MSFTHPIGFYSITLYSYIYYLCCILKNDVNTILITNKMN